MNDVLVSVIIPVYNAEKYLAECIESVVNQTEQSWQLILVNDGSVDLSDSICQSYAEKDSRICYIKQENAGVSAARNAGIEKASGKWITFLDADDTLSQDALSLPTFSEQNVQMIMGGHSNIIDGLSFDKKSISITAKAMQLCILDIVSFKKQYPETSMIGVYNHWSVWGRFFLTSIIKENGICFSKDIRLGEDLLFCMEYYNNINSVALNYSKIYFYRPNEASVSRTFQKSRVNNTVLLTEELKKHVKENGLKKAYYRFVVNRVAKCCFDYYANPKCNLSKQEKIESLENMCGGAVLNEAIMKAPYTHLAPGKKDSVLYAVVLAALKRGKYNSALKLAEMAK